jgi:glycosyltransferase involved in cell wall biosynthesis
MIKVALITSWGERCGIAEYAKNLIDNCLGVKFEIIPRTMNISEAIDLISSCDVVQSNYEPGILSHWNENVIRSLNKPSVLTLHTSHDGNNRSEFTNAFSRVVVHEKTTDGFTFIPMGIPKCTKAKPDVTFDVGTVGFPFPWKGFTQVVEACKLLDLHCVVIIPESRHADSQEMKKHLLSLHDKVTVITEWMSQDQVVMVLSGAKVTAFPFHGGNYGISASCRLGLATGNPIVLSRSRQFRDLFDYEKEIEFVDQPPTTKDVAIAIQNQLYPQTWKRPETVLQDFSWERMGLMYKTLYGELVY